MVFWPYNGELTSFVEGSCGSLVHPPAKVYYCMKVRRSTSTSCCIDTQRILQDHRCQELSSRVIWELLCCLCPRRINKLEFEHSFKIQVCYCTLRIFIFRIYTCDATAAVLRGWCDHSRTRNRVRHKPLSEIILMHDTSSHPHILTMLMFAALTIVLKLQYLITLPRLTYT